MCSARGDVEFAGEGSSRTALHVIHQDLGLVAELNTVENLAVTANTEARALAPTKGQAERKRAEELLRRFGQAIDVMVPVGALTPAQRAIVAIARALDGWTHSRNVLVLDEPTEALHAAEVEILFTAIRRLAAEGAGIVFISHRLDEVLELADRVVVLRDGEKVADVPATGLDHDQLVDFVTGEGSRLQGVRTRVGDRSAPILEARGLRGSGVSNVDLRMHAGEVLGVAGVLGSGRDVLPSLLFGALPATAHSFVVAEAPYDRRSPKESVRRRMAFVPGDRARLGGIRTMTARENLTLTALSAFTGRLGAIRSASEREAAATLLSRHDVRPARSEQMFSQFSGGNQQKIVLAKWLHSMPLVLILEEPTQGVDIGAKHAIYAEIDAAAEQGVAVLVCSSDAKELVRLCDRVLVMREGSVAVELGGDTLSEANVVLEGHGLVDAHDQEGLPR